MNKVIELHDSEIEYSEYEANELTIYFSSLVVIVVDNKKAPILSQTEYKKGKFVLSNCYNGAIITRAEIFDGELLTEGKSLSVIPLWETFRNDVILALDTSIASFSFKGRGFHIELFN